MAKKYVVKSKFPSRIPKIHSFPSSALENFDLIFEGILLANENIGGLLANPNGGDFLETDNLSCFIPKPISKLYDEFCGGKQDVNKQDVRLQKQDCFYIQIFNSLVRPYFTNFIGQIINNKM